MRRIMLLFKLFCPSIHQIFPGAIHVLFGFAFMGKPNFPYVFSCRSFRHRRFRSIWKPLINSSRTSRSHHLNFRWRLIALFIVSIRFCQVTTDILDMKVGKDDQLFSADNFNVISGDLCQNSVCTFPMPLVYMHLPIQHFARRVNPASLHSLSDGYIKSYAFPKNMHNEVALRHKIPQALTTWHREKK